MGRQYTMFGLIDGVVRFPDPRGRSYAHVGPRPAQAHMRLAALLCLAGCGAKEEPGESESEAEAESEGEGETEHAFCEDAGDVLGCYKDFDCFAYDLAPDALAHWLECAAAVDVTDKASASAFVDCVGEWPCAADAAAARDGCLGRVCGDDLGLPCHLYCYVEDAAAVACYEDGCPEWGGCGYC